MLLSMNTIEKSLKNGAQQLEAISSTPMLDVELLMAHICGYSRSMLISHENDVLSAEQYKRFLQLLEQRSQGVPLAYLTHEKEFYGRSFYVDERVLIPRPETEHLIELILNHIGQQHLAHPRILDIGTGSGIIAITLQKEIPASVLVASDIDAGALTIAKRNARTHSAHINFIESDLYSHITGKFNILVSNPPYVNPEHTQQETHLTKSLAYEPQHALYAKTHPFAIVENIIRNAPQHLKASGAVFIEIGADQGELAAATAQHAFPHADVAVHKDYAGLDRVLSIITT